MKQSKLNSPYPNIKSRKASKDKEKRKSTSNENFSNPFEKGSPSKEGNSPSFAGISSDIIHCYAEQSLHEYVPEEVCNVLAEDINHKLRCIINNALVKAKLSGRTTINIKDVDDTFKHLSIDRIYGAPENPTWVPTAADQRYIELDDKLLNLVDFIEDEAVYSQPGEVILTKSWINGADGSSHLKNYFVTMCEAVVSDDPEIRNYALTDISTNAHLGPIIQWFYHFAFLLLSKDNIQIKVEGSMEEELPKKQPLTQYAMDLVITLENSPLGSVNVTMKQLKLLVRLLLQRLLHSSTHEDFLRPMCNTIATLCYRSALYDFVVEKLEQKLYLILDTHTIPLLGILNCLGVHALQRIFEPNMLLFLLKVDENFNSSLRYYALETYYTMLRHEFNNDVHLKFYSVFGNSLITRKYFCKNQKSDIEVDYIGVKKELIKTRRRIDYKSCRTNKKIILTTNAVFEVPLYTETIMKNLRQFEEKRPSTSVQCFNINFGKTKFFEVPFYTETIMENRRQFEEKRPSTNVQCFNIKFGKIKFLFKNKISSSKTMIANLRQFDEKRAPANVKSYIEIGKTTFLLPLFQKKIKTSCYEHILATYNF